MLHLFVFQYFDKDFPVFFYALTFLYVPGAFAFGCFLIKGVEMRR